jgi:electron transport complex protein RnfD
MSARADRLTDAAGPPEAIPPADDSPFLRAPEGARTVFLVTLAAACAPLAAGVLLFGWRAAVVAALSVAGCATIERLYYRVTRVPALLGRTHAYLTGVLLALTLPAFVPWYVPLVAAAFAIIVGKAVFGGVGHFVWQPALVGRLAVAVMFPAQLVPLAADGSPRPQAVLARSHLLWGDVRRARRADDTRPWRGRPAPTDAHAFALTPPARILHGLTDRDEPSYRALVFVPAELRRPRPACLLQMPPIDNLFYGARPGGLGETCVLIIVVAGLYLIYRNYVRWQLPLAFLAAAWCAAAVAPIYLVGPNNVVETVWLPLLTREGAGVGFTYVNYQMLSGGLLLAAFFLATEMTSRPVTAGGQTLFGLGCGVLAMGLQLYTDLPIPGYMAVLAMNTVAPTIDRFWRPRVFGMRRFAFLRRAR